MRETAQGRQRVCINRIVTDNQGVCNHLPCRPFLISLLCGELVMPRYGVGGGGRPSVAFGDGQVIKIVFVFKHCSENQCTCESILKVVIKVSLSLGDGLDLLNLDLDVGKSLAGGLLGRQAVEQGGGLGVNPVGRRAVDRPDGHFSSKAVPEGGRARSLDYEATLRKNEEGRR